MPRIAAWSLVAVVGALSLGAPLAAQIEVFVEVDEIPITDVAFVGASAPGSCPWSDESDWNVSAGEDGNVVVTNADGVENFIDWEIDWLTGGTKDVTISLTGCDAQPETIQIQVNSCRFVQSSYEVSEGDGEVTVQVERYGGAAGQLFCTILPNGGTATPDQDAFPYLQPFFWDEENFQTAVIQDYLLEIADDDLVEPTETVELLLALGYVGQPVKGAPKAVRVGSPVHGDGIADQATVNILDDDPASVSFSAAQYSGSEYDGLIELTLERQGADGAFDVQLAVTGGSAIENVDFFLSETEVSFGVGVNSRTVFVFPAFDNLAEATESFSLALVSPTNGVTLGAQSATTVQILDYGVCRFVQDTYVAFEGAGTAAITVRRLGGTAGELICNVSAFAPDAPNAATPGVDFVPDSQDLFWADGAGGDRVFPVQLLDDDVVEGAAPEVVALELRFSELLGAKTPGGGGPPDAASIRVPRAGAFFDPFDFATLLIQDDEGSILTFLDPSSQALETDGLVSIGVLRSGNTAGALSVDVIVVAGAAAAGVDYSLPDPPTLTWAAGEGGIRSFEVTLIADDLAEPDEGALFGLANASVDSPSAPSPSIGAPGTHLLTIVDVPSRGMLRFTDESFTGVEGDETVTVGVERVGGTVGAVSVDVCLGEGTAEPADLGLPSPTTLSWADGESGEKLVELGVVDDFEIEGIEAVALELCAATGDPKLGDPSVATLVLLDNDFETSEETVVAGPLGGPEDPIVVYGRDGRKIVVWVAEDGDGLGVFAQLYDPDDNPLGEPFRINQDPAGDSTQPSAVIRDDGTIVIVWREVILDGVRLADGRQGAAAAQGSSMVARSFNPNGAPSGEQVVVSTGGVEDSQNPEVGTDKDGELVITWQDGGKVKGKVFDEKLAPKTPVLDISELVGALAPEVAVAASGDFVVVWQQLPGAPGAAAVAAGTIVARSFNDQGVAKGEAEVVTENAQAVTPAVSIDDQGNFFVVFSEPGVEGLDVFGRLFDRRGRRKGPKIRVNQKVAGDQVLPRVDMNAIGDIAIVWQNQPLGLPGAASAEGTSIAARGFNPQAQPQTGDIEVAATEAGSAPQDPDVSIEDGDEVTVVFEKKGPGNESEGIFKKVIDTNLFSGPASATGAPTCASRRPRASASWSSGRTSRATRARARRCRSPTTAATSGSSTPTTSRS
jgi:hypothetical protein